MRIENIQSRVTFGIFKKEIPTRYGNHVIGKYKDYNVEVYTDKTDGVMQNKLFYISDKFLNWVKHKLIMYKDGKKFKVVQSSRADFVR